MKEVVVNVKLEEKLQVSKTNLNFGNLLSKKKKIFFRAKVELPRWF